MVLIKEKRQKKTFSSLFQCIFLAIPKIMSDFPFHFQSVPQNQNAKLGLYLPLKSPMMKS